MIARHLLFASSRAIRWAVIGVAIASSGCSTPQANSSVNQRAAGEMRALKLHVLRHEELRRLLVGRALGHPPVAPILWPDFSVFEEGGRYLHFGHRNVRTVGSYVIGNDWVCVRQPQQPESCFMLGTNERGEYFSKGLWSNAGPPTLVEVHPSR
jgi:hypothetical protein